MAFLDEYDWFSVLWSDPSVHHPRRIDGDDFGVDPLDPCVENVHEVVARARDEGTYTSR